jgi:hypothetical protein
MKTNATVRSDVYHSDLKEGDTGYIDGYVTCGDGGGGGIHYAVFVRTSDGLIDLVSINLLKALTQFNMMDMLED